MKVSAALAFVRQDWWDLPLLCGLLALNFRSAIQAIRNYDEIARDLASDCVMRAIVLRDEDFVDVDSKELVPGDIIHIREVR